MSSPRRIAFNLLTFVPGVGTAPFVQERLRRRAIGAQATQSARYCYSVWLRHLCLAAESGCNTDFRVIAELGPGASLGAGLAGLLCGSERYYAFDVVQHTRAGRNRLVLEELITLFQQRAPVPDEREFPQVKPRLKSYAFPHHLLTAERLERALAPQRLERIRGSLENLTSPDSMVQYRAPWTDEAVVEENSVDLIFSQAVFEHIDDLPGAYRSLWRWLRPGGINSHTIDFRSHGWSRYWDGHWRFSDLTWKLIRGKDVWSINREPCSTHRRLIAQSGFRIINEQVTRTESTASRSRLASRFQSMPEDDRTISGVFLQYTK